MRTKLESFLGKWKNCSITSKSRTPPLKNIKDGAAKVQIQSLSQPSTIDLAATKPHRLKPALLDRPPHAEQATEKTG
jgi:hypothetical protein